MPTQAPPSTETDDLRCQLSEAQDVIRELLDAYWGDGDGVEPPPACIVRAQTFLASAS